MIMDIDVDSADRIIVVGDFTRFDVIKCQNIIRLNPDGQIDSTFDSGIGAVGIVNSVSVQPDDRIVIAGDFSLYNGSPVGGISRLNVDGSLDKGFNDALPAIELTDHIFSRVEVLEDGRILAAGSVVASVEEEGGASKTYRGVLKLNRDGSVDTGFQPDSSILLADPHYGPNGNIDAMTIQPDGYVLLGGEFTRFHGEMFNRIVRLAPNGEVDSTINFGWGANNDILDIIVQNDFRITVSGRFTEFDQKSNLRLARLYGGMNFDQGSVRFDGSNYSINEDGTHDSIWLRRVGGVSTSASVVLTFSSDGVPEKDGVPANPALDMEDYIPVNALTLDFGDGEIFKEIIVRSVDSDKLDLDRESFDESGNPVIYVVNDRVAEDEKLVELKLTDFIGMSAGTQTEALISLVSDDAAIEFEEAFIDVRESSSGGKAFMMVNRLGPLDQTISVDYRTRDGTAVSSGLLADYSESAGVLHFYEGQTRRIIEFPILDDTHQEGRENFYVELVNPSPKGSVYIKGESVGEVTIVDIDQDALRSRIEFGQTEYNVYETDGVVQLSFVRSGDLGRESSLVREIRERIAA